MSDLSINGKQVRQFVFKTPSDGALDLIFEHALLFLVLLLPHSLVDSSHLVSHDACQNPLVSGLYLSLEPVLNVFFQLYFKTASLLAFAILENLPLF